jgi:hypothetical protein
MTETFARIVAHLDSPSTTPDEWHTAWTAHLQRCRPYRYAHPGGGYATFRPTGKTLAVLAELVRLADEDGLASATYDELSLQLGVAEPASLAPHLRALRHLGIIERYTRGTRGNLYRLALERLPGRVPVA